MKTAREYLKENDFIANEHGNYVYGCGYHNVSLVHILQEYASIYANQKLDEAKNHNPNLNWIFKDRLDKLKDEL